MCMCIGQLLCGVFVVFFIGFTDAVSLDREKREIVGDDVQAYLMRFGYMEKAADGAFALRTEQSVRNALRELQEFAGLPASGRLDVRTKKLLQTPRCGLPDKVQQTSGRRKRYAIHGEKWPYTDLTWKLNRRNLGHLDPYEVRLVISKALEVWSRHSKLTFRETNDNRADIQIHFHRGDHGDNFPFDGKGSVLAHAFFPTDTGRSVDVHFDADESWIASGSSEQGTNLFNVAAHEIGHSLGLSHSNKEGTLMYPWYNDLTDGLDYELPEDDRLAIQYLYGAREERQWETIPRRPPSTRGTTTTTTTTTTSTTTTTTRPPPRYFPDPRFTPGRYPYVTRRTEKPHHPPKGPMNPNKKFHHRKTYHDRYPYKPERHPHHNHPSYPPTRDPTTTVPEKRPVERRPKYPPKESPDRKPPPDTCDTNYDAVAVIRREVFIFKDAYFWRINDEGLMAGYPAEINRLWHGLPANLTHVDAVYERPDHIRSIVFFIGDKYYVLNGSKVELGYPKPLTHLGLPSTLKKIDGAMVWGHNGQTYFYSGDLYWRFDEELQTVELDYPRKMTMWQGVGSDIDAVFQWKDGKTYFFKDKHFWKFDDQHMRIVRGYPRPSAPFWMGCTKNIQQNDVVEKLPYTGLEITSGVKRITLNDGLIYALIVICYIRM